MTEVRFTADLGGWTPDKAIRMADFVDFRKTYTKTDFFGIGLSKSVHTTSFKTIKQIQSIVERVCTKTAKVSSVSEYSFAIFVPDELFIQLVCSQSEPWKEKTFSLQIEAFGPEQHLAAFHHLVEAEVIETFDSGFVKWNYIIKGAERAVKEIILPRPKTVIHQEFYPWLEQKPEDYIDDFLNSDSNVLILRGEPGTGKTSFIRHLITSRPNYRVMITYEERLFDSDELFAEFISGDHDALILEDADKMITDRVRSGNSAMSRFLNVSDGLIKFPNKKIIITANCVEDHMIDEALMRPGRCFHAPVFRKLTFAEMQKAAAVAGVNYPPVEADYTLAEMFAFNANTVQKTMRRKAGVGFV